MTKKAYLGRMLDKGLVFRKADARGKCFIEYLPSDASLFPVNAPGYMHISYFWVSGSLKGHGYGSALLEAAIKDAREKGFVLVYSDACPYTAEYVPEIVKFFRDRNTDLKIRKIESHEDALSSPAVWTTWSLFKDGKLITHEILNEKKAEKLLKEYF